MLLGFCSDCPFVCSEFIYGLCFLLCQFRVSGFTYADVFDPLELRLAHGKRYRSNFILLQATISQLEGPGQISGHQVAGASLVGISWGSDEYHRGLDGHRGSGCPCQAVVRLCDLNGERLGGESRQLRSWSTSCMMSRGSLVGSILGQVSHKG